MTNAQHVNLLAWRPAARRRLVLVLLKRSVVMATFSCLGMVLLAAALHQWCEYRQATVRHFHSFDAADAGWRTALSGLEQQQQVRRLESGRYASWLAFRDGQLLLWSLLTTQPSALAALKQVRFSEGGWELSLGLELAEAAEIARQWQQREPDAAIEVLDRRAEDGGFTRIRLTRREAANATNVLRSTQP